jgi:GTP-dependent phosphoenolpyruvate carboxykinase
MLDARVVLERQQRHALLGKKCLALRIASVMARDEGWLAEHMLILKLTSPEGEVSYITGAFPSACGKTNLAMLVPTLPGWQVQTIGDDIAWMKFGEDGRLYAINPEAGFFGVAPGTGYETNPNAMKSIEANTIFTNCARTDDGDVWWEGMTPEAPEPFAMLPFCGYDMADYFAHWLQIEHDGDPEKLPRIFYVNWFRKDGDGKFLWPGYGENSRVLAWIFRRCEGAANAEKTPIGLIPAAGELDLTGLDVSPQTLAQLLEVDVKELRAELPQIAEHLAQFGEQLPGELRGQLTRLQSELNRHS